MIAGSSRTGSTGYQPNIPRIRPVPYPAPAPVVTIPVPDPAPDAPRDLFNAMVTVAQTGKGPAEQIPSMGCSIKWKSEA